MDHRGTSHQDDRASAKSPAQLGPPVGCASSPRVTSRAVRDDGAGVLPTGGHRGAREAPSTRPRADTGGPAVRVVVARRPDASYDSQWGTLLKRTRPTIGNHEYCTCGATGYYAYFRDRQPGPPGYYRFQVGGWKMYLLNSNCPRVSCPEEAAWIERQMKAYPLNAPSSPFTILVTRSGSEHGNNLR